MTARDITMTSTNTTHDLSTPTLDLNEALKEEVFQSMYDSERRACALRDYEHAWNERDVEGVLRINFPNTSPEVLSLFANRVVSLHAAVLKAHDDEVSQDINPDMVNPSLVADMQINENRSQIMQAYTSVLAFMKSKAMEGLHISNGTNHDWIMSFGVLRKGSNLVDFESAITLDDITDEMWGRIMQIAGQGHLTEPNTATKPEVNAGGRPPYFVIGVLVALIAVVATGALKKDGFIGKFLTGSGDSGKPPATEPASQDGIPQVPGVEGGDGPDPDPNPMTPVIENPAGEIPIATVTVAPPSPTPDVLTIEKLATIPAQERVQMMMEANPGLDIEFTTSVEAPHLGFEIVQEEDGSYSIGRVYNILTGELIEVPQRANNVGADTFTYVDQDWQSLDQEALGHVQVFPRVDGKGVVVLKMPAQYAVFSDDPSTTEVREFLTKKAPESATQIEMPTFASFDDAMKYVIFVKGARYGDAQESRLLGDPEAYRAGFWNFYGGFNIAGGEVSTPDGNITFSMGLRLLPNGDLAISFLDIKGVYTQVVIKMVDGLDSNGRTSTELADIIHTATGDPKNLAVRSNPDSENTLPLIPADFAQ